MKKTIPFLIAALTIWSCSDSEKKKNIKIGAVQESVSQKTQDPLEESLTRGKKVYTSVCIQCHLANGKGVPGNFPPLAGSNWLEEKRTESIRVVKYGQKGEIKVNGITYNGVMAPMGLSDKQVADVLNYVMNSWGNSQDKMVTAAEVANVEE